VLKRSLESLRNLVSRALGEVRCGFPDRRQTFSLASFMADAQSAAQLEATTAGCALAVPSVDPLLGLRGNRELLLAALANLLQNAFKFTLPQSEVTLNAFALGEQILIEVKDHCGGLPEGSAERMFTPFRQCSGDKSGLGLGLGLSIARQSIEADSGTLGVRNVPGSGCVFTIYLPLHHLE
jgi:signal transduction histidine kinase